MAIEELFLTAGRLLMNYETGDFLLLSELSDLLSDLKDHFLHDDDALHLIERAKLCVTSEMKKAGIPNFAEEISRGIDFLQSLYTASPEERIDILKLIEKHSCVAPKEQLKKGAEKISIPEHDIESIAIFVADARDRLNKAQELILYLEEKPEDKSSIQELFRIFHTIKGECGFLKIATLGELTHSIENILEELRSGKSKLSANHIDVLLEGVDLSRDLVDRLNVGELVLHSDIPIDLYLNRLKDVLGPRSSSLGEILISKGKLQEEDVSYILGKQKDSAFSKRFGEIAVQEDLLSPEDLQEAVLSQRKKSDSVQDARIVERSDPVIKVKASKVNYLVDMIGELLIALGQLDYEDAEFMQVRKITRILQMGAMDLRTDSLHGLFGAIKRGVRDLSKQLKKNVRLDYWGEDLEIDRNLIEKLEAPLMHLVRNAIDHGIGDEEERVSLGKEGQGIIRLSAERHGNSVAITVRDSGRGLDREVILQKAIERNLVNADYAENLSDQAIFNFIFNSGFSTKKEVSQLSGRGVGMDVVQAVVTENRGRIEVDSEKGKFTEVRLLFPLSTAIIDGMISRVGENLFIFPIGSVIESFKVDKNAFSSVHKQTELLVHREESIPVLRMHKLFGIEPDSDREPSIGIVCEASDQKKYLFLLDELLAKQEVVIKSLGPRFTDLKGISSGTVLAGGKVGLVVDIDEIVALSTAGIDI